MLEKLFKLFSKTQNASTSQKKISYDYKITFGNGLELKDLTMSDLINYTDNNNYKFKPSADSLGINYYPETVADAKYNPSTDKTIGLVEQQQGDDSKYKVCGILVKQEEKTENINEQIKNYISNQKDVNHKLFIERINQYKEKSLLVEKQLLHSNPLNITDYWSNGYSYRFIVNGWQCEFVDQDSWIICTTYKKDMFKDADISHSDFTWLRHDRPDLYNALCKKYSYSEEIITGHDLTLMVERFIQKVENLR
jgi:hypothetical protein